MKSEYYERNVDMRGGLLTRIWDAAARMPHRDHHPSPTTRDLRTGAAECSTVDGGILEHFGAFWNIYCEL